MPSLITLPLAAVLLASPVSGVPGLGWFKGFRSRQPVPTDSIPTPWRPASALTLENRFVRATLPALGPQRSAIRLVNDPRKLRVAFDPDSGRVRYGVEYSGVPLGDPARPTVREFAADLRARTFERMWASRAREALLTSGAVAGMPGGARPGGFSLPLPDVLPRPVQRLLGPGSPAINVLGSANLTISGQSYWTNQQLGPLGQRRSLFPTLNVQQDLNIQVEGQLSDRVRVNLLQNSAYQIPLQNRIAINYKGDEDDLVQALDLGNTNLSLPGTQYVSYSGRNEGLFGAKVATRVGPVDFTVLASKQEGRSERSSYSGGFSQQTQSLADFDYVKGVYYFLYDPNADFQKVDAASIEVYLDEGTYPNPAGLVRGRAYLDPRTFSDPADSTRVLGDPASPRTMLRGNFRPLKPGADQDYEVLPNVYGENYLVLRMRRAITAESQMLAVRYRYQLVEGGPFLPMGVDSIPEADGGKSIGVKLIRAPLAFLPSDASGQYFDTTAVFYPTRELELRNFYQLGGQGIDPKTFQLSISRGDDEPPLSNYQVPGGPVIPYIELLGLDSYDESGGFPGFGNFGHDQKVDGTAPTPGERAFVDFTTGTLFLPDLRPFAPRLQPGRAGPFDRAVSARLSRRDSLVGTPAPPGEAGESNSANPAIYDKRTPRRDQDRLYWIDVTYTASRVGNEINLGRTNILEGSESVIVNGQTWQRDRDYRIDYDLGRITLVRALGPADQLNVDYAYAPLFAQAGRTLVGSAFTWEGRDKRFGGAFMYESKGAQDLRPRIGEEPSRTFIGDLNTEWRFRPSWLTRLVDRLPGVRTTAASDLMVQAEVGASFPNPNTKNEVYIDDMEGARDAVTLSMSPERWQWSSVPPRDQFRKVDHPAAERPRKNAEIHWFTPLTSVLERDLRPYLSDGQGARNTHNSLAISLPRRPAAATAADTLWAGLTYPLDAVGIDLSRAQFIELWVNDFRDFYRADAPDGRIRGRNVRLHVELGVVSEDQQRAPNVPANDILDTEDKPPYDNQLSATDDNNEDTGLDNRLNPGEPAAGLVPDLVTVTSSDPAGDDFALPNEFFGDFDPRRWVNRNGTEDNRTRYDRPDTEDLNLNTALDTQESFFRWTIDLGLDGPNAPFLVDSAYKAGATYLNDNTPVPADNGWRYYRIPINDATRRQFGSPDLALARHVRVWLDGVYETDPAPLSEKDGRPYLVLGDIAIVGSRWVAAELDTAQQGRGTTVTISTLNNTDNADIYSSPFDPGQQKEGNRSIPRREQSVVLEFENLGPRDSVEVFRSFSLDEDYTRYGSLDFYVTGFRVPGYVPDADSLRYFVRFASDDRGSNYYEFRAPLPMRSDGTIDWREIKVELTELSNYKLDPSFPVNAPQIYYRVPGPARYPNSTVIIKGRPSFTRLRRVSFGLVNEDPVKSWPSGMLWVNEIRAREVKRVTDHAQRLVVSGRAANLLSYSLNYNGRGPDFQSVGEARGTGTETSALGANGTFELHRFFEATGILLPVNFNYSTNRSSPRFTAGDDIVRTGEAAKNSETRSVTNGYGVAYSRSWSERSNPFLRYTLGGITANLSQGWRKSVTPTSADTGSSLNAAVNYQIAPRNLLPVTLPLTKLKVFPLPERFYWNYAIATTEATGYSRLGTGGQLVRSQTLKGRQASIDFGASTRPIDLIRHDFSARRNLTLPEHQRETIGFVNLGRVVQWRQAFDSRLALQRFGPWVKPTVSLNTNYNQNNGPELSSDLGTRSVNNGMNVSLNWQLPFDRLAYGTSVSRGAVGRLTAADSARQDSLQKRRAGQPFWRRLAGRLGGINTDTRFSRNSSYSRLTGTPDLLYLVGLESDPGFGDSTGVRALAGNVESRTEDFSTSANARIDVGLGATVGTRIEYGKRRNQSSGARSRSDRLRFPDFEVNYGRVAEAVQLKRFFSNPQLRTVFGRSVTTDYINSDRPTRETRSSEWRPLIGFTGDLKNGTRTELRIERRVTQSDDAFLGATQQRTDRFTDVQFSLSRSYSQGQKMTFMGKETTVRQRIDLGFTAAYSRNSSDQERPQPVTNRLITQKLTSNDQLSANVTGAYGFSNNVTGNLELGFRQDRNLLTTITTRSLRIQLRAQFTF